MREWSLGGFRAVPWQNPGGARLLREGRARSVTGPGSPRKGRAGSGGERAGAIWHRADPPSDEDVLRLCRTIRIRVLRLLHRRGVLDEAPDANEQPSLLSLIAAASVQGRTALEPEVGARLGRLGTPVVDPSAAPTAPLCANIEGFSLHAAVRIPAGQRDRLERLCR